jgi:cytochrome c556
MLNKRLLAAFIVTISIISAPVLLAHGGATGIVKERMDLMDDMKSAMKELSSIFKGQQAYDAEVIRQAASTINQHSGDAITRLFPENSLKHSEAKPAIWQEWQHFKDLADRQERLSQGLYNAAENNHTASAGNMMGADNMMTNSGMMSNSEMMSNQNMMGAMISGSSGDLMLNSPMDTTEHYSGMPSEMVFRTLAENCSSCHKNYRKKD